LALRSAWHVEMSKRSLSRVESPRVTPLATG
jgi:hypothetical protein